MPQLDFREALSTPDEKVLSVSAPVPAAVPTAPAHSFLREIGLSHSTWANIIFVTIATVGGLVSAFYFFNGGELLQAAAAWPSEFLYPRPLSANTINVAVQPVSVDQYGNDATSTTTKNGDNQDSANQDFRTPQLAQAPPPTETGRSIPITPPLPGGTILPPAPPITPITPILPVPPLPPVVPPPTDSIFNELNTLPTGTATFVQSLYQTVNDTVTTVLPKNLPTTTASTRKKVVSTRSKAVVRGAGTMKSSSQATQKITTQLQAPVVQNQTMFGGGMGSPGGVAGVGSAGSAGGVGGTGVSAGGVGS